MLIAQITDFHVKASGMLAFGRVDTSRHLEQAVSALLALSPQPDVILATGDLVDSGDPSEYEHVRYLLRRLTQPVFVIPGNHDNREALRAAFSDCDYLPTTAAFLNYTVEKWPVRLIALDTLVEGTPGGRLCRERVSWLSDRLSDQPARPTVLFMHHPPIRTGIEHMDAMGLSGVEDLAHVVAHHRQIERIMCGHVHRSIQARFAGTIASVAPSTAHQVSLDLEAAKPGTFTLEPPGYQLHLWRPEIGLVTHTAFIGAFPGPFRFE
jgi:3',5'-cyclic-AMP phosphodiesterase